MLSNYSSLYSLLPLLSFSSASQQHILNSDDPGPFTSKFGQLANETLELFHVPGVAVAVVDGDNMWAEGYGIASFPSSPVTPSTLFYCGSTTKAFTAAAISLLIDNSTQYSNIQWSTPISDLIRDDFVLENDYATTHTTIEDALSHRSGLPRHDFSYGVRKATVKSTVRDLRYLKLTAQPRTKFQYCNLMFVVASHVVETLTGVWLGDFLKERIWEPLGMRSTYFSTPDAQAAPEVLAQGYVYRKESLLYQPVPFMDLSVVSGAGSVISNVLDYSKWIKALLSLSEPISPKGYEELLTSRTIIEKQEPSYFPGTGSYALGWVTGTYQGYEFFWHSGGMEAFGAELIFFPKLKYGVVTLGNTATTSNAVGEKLMWHLIDERLGVKEEERFDWNKKNLDNFKQLEQKVQNASRIFYPSVPDPPIPASLPLESYTGTYFNAGYHNVSIILKNDQLFFNRSEATWKVNADLEHISGDYFMVYVDSMTAPGFIFRDPVPAEFKVGADGVSKAFGILAEIEMGLDSRIWFDRT